MDLNPVSIVAMIVFGLIGMILFASGKRNQNMPHLVCGVLLMAYPYVVSGPILTVAIGVVLCVVAWVFRGF